MTRYLITSGNSQVGKLTISALRSLGENDIVAGARDVAASEASLKSAGASQVVLFDFAKQATVINALKGVDRVLIVHGYSADNVGCTKQVTDAAVLPGSTVKVISRITGYLSDPESSDSIARTHGLCALALKETGLTWFTIGPNFFFENWLAELPAIKSGSVYGASGEGRTGYVAASDIGAVAAHALKNPEKYNGRHLQVSGPAALTETECLNAINAATGLSAKYISFPRDQFSASLKENGLPPQLIEVLLQLADIKLNSRAGATTQVVKEVTGHEPKTVAQWAHENAARFK